MGDTRIAVLMVVGVIAIVTALFALIAYAVIWALNTLFGLGIEFNFWTALAVIVLIWLVFGSYNRSRSED